MTGKSRHRAVTDLCSAREQLVELTEGLMEFRSEVLSLVPGLAGLAEQQQAGADEARREVSEWCSRLEWALVESFDPLLRSLLALAGGPRSVVLESVLDLEVVKRRLRRVAAGLPPSALEAAVLAGDVEPHPPMDLRLTIETVILHHLNEAADLLLEATELDPR